MMFSFTANDGRILTPPKELKPILKGAYSAFYNLLGHIRFFYVVDEVWDGVSSLIFMTAYKQLASVNINNNFFEVIINNIKTNVADETMLDAIFEHLKKIALPNQIRPIDQLSVDLEEYVNGIRCDLCLIYSGNNTDDYSGNRQFPFMDKHCYYGVEEGWGTTEFSTWTCSGKTMCFEKSYACLEKKGFKNCYECGEFRTCNECGVGHEPGQCNLGITAEEVTKLIIPYCEVERLNLLCDYSK